MGELAALVGAATLYMVLAMWATQPASSCNMTEEPHRYLNLERDVDREHLDRDVREIERFAERYAKPLPSTTANAECQDVLARQLMETHEVTREQIRAALSTQR